MDASAVGNAGFKFAFHQNLDRAVERSRIDDGDIAFLVIGENVLAGGIVHDAVGNAGGLYRGGDFQRLEVKNLDAALLAGGDKAQVLLGRQGYAMYAISSGVGNGANENAVFEIDDLHGRGARNV